MDLPPLRLSVYRRLDDGRTGRYVGQPELQTVGGARLLARQDSEETGNDLESYYLRRSDYLALFEKKSQS